MQAWKMAVAAAAAATSLSAAAAEIYPARAVRFLIPYPPGGGTDLLGRLLGRGLSESLGVPVIIDNRPGGNGTIAPTIAARAAPDGHTLVIINSSFVVGPLLTRDLPYDVNKSFRHVIRAAESPNIIIARSSFPAATLADLVALAKAKPDGVTYAEAGFGGPSHLATELFKYLTGTQIRRISYKGTGPALTDMLGAHVDVMFASITGPLVHVRSGKLKALAVTGTLRSPAVPDVPTVIESGVKGYEFVSWYGILLPAGTPDPVTTRVHDALRRTLEQEDVRKALAAEGGQVTANPPEEFTRYVAAETKRWTEIIGAMKIRPER